MKEEQIRLMKKEARSNNIEKVIITSICYLIFGALLSYL